MGRCLHTWLCFMLSAAAWLGAAVSSVPAADTTHSDDDGLGRLIRTQSPWHNPEAQGNLVRSERFFYDGIRRIQELVTDPVSNLASASVSTSAPVQQAANQALEGPDELDPSAAPGSVEAAQGVEATAITVSTLAREYVWGPGDKGIDELFTQFDHLGKPWWTLQDSGGDIVALVEVPNATVPPSSSNAARVAAQWTYDAYGSVLSAEHLYPHPLMHCGHKAMFFDRLDVGVVDLTSNSELPRLIPFAHAIYHNRNRVYNPQIGRFMQQDPNATAMSLIEGSHSGRGAGAVALAFSTEERYGDGYNLYQYLGSNPWNRSDPMGLSSDPFDMVDEYLAEDAGSRAAFMASMGRQAVSLAILAAQITTYLPFPAANVAGELALAMMGEQSMEAASMAIAIGFIPGGKIMSGAGKALKAVGRFAARAMGALWNVAKSAAGHMGGRLWQAGSSLMKRAAAWLAKTCGCFEAQTTVWTRRGLVPIESVREGDEVLAQDEYSGESSWRRVVRTFVRQGAPIVAVTVATSASLVMGNVTSVGAEVLGSAVTINTTEDHPFLVNGCEWVAAGSLNPGAKLHAEQAGDTRVVSVQFTGRLADVYNFEVDGLHNYRVGLGGVVVHNSGFDPFKCWPGLEKQWKKHSPEMEFERMMKAKNSRKGPNHAVWTTTPDNVASLIARTVENGKPFNGTVPIPSEWAECFQAGTGSVIPVTEANSGMESGSQTSSHSLQEEFLMMWRDEAERFCRDLGLCDMMLGGEYWGANNADPSKLVVVAHYWGENRDQLSEIGKGMIIAFMAASACVALSERPLSLNEEQLVKSVIEAARESPPLSSYVWYFIDETGPGDSLNLDDPFTAWFATQFPGWRPRHWP